MTKLKNRGSKKKFLIKFAVWFAALFLTIILTHEWLFSIGPLKSLELRLIDARFSRRGAINIEDSADVIILKITQETHNLIPLPYRWPWPRIIWANIIENLNEAEVKAIGIDIVMSGQDWMDPAYDTLMTETIRKYGNVVVAGEMPLEQESKKESGDSYQTNLAENFNNIFFGADSSIGIVNTPGDYDEVYRRYRPFVHFSIQDKNYPSFSFALLNKYFNLPPLNTALNEPDKFVLADREIPKFDNTSMLINFYGADRTFPSIDLSQVIDDKDFQTSEELEYETDINMWDNPDYGILYSGRLKDKIVIIGSTMPVDKDFFNIAIAKTDEDGSNKIAGVEFHANALQNVLWNDFLKPQSTLFEVIFLVILSLLVFYGSSYIKQKKIKHHFLLEIMNVFLVIIVIYAIYEVSVYLFIEYKLVISIVSPLLTVIFSYFASTAYHFISERSQSKMIKGMFSHYVSSTLVNELVQNPDKLKLGGEKRNLTILFSDIAGFTSISERMGAEELVEFINEYLTEMTKIVINNSGTLDKYIGDAIMAFWGAPLPMEDHALQACKTAVQMQKQLEVLRKKWDLSEDQQIRIRIGINTGDVVVGNIGGQNRFDYTVMGDTVNLASRLEGANKQYGTLNMISEYTCNTVNSDVVTRELDYIRVKGKKKPTRVYELIGLREDEEAVKKLEDLKIYFEGLRKYQDANFLEAKKSFLKASELLPHDEPSKLYVERCQYYIENPPDKDWNRVFIMKSK